MTSYVIKLRGFMLPFQKKKQAANQTGVLIQTRDNSEKPSINNDFLDICGEQLIRAISTGDAKAAIFALRVIHDKFHEEMDEKPESSNPSPHSYESQNIKAGNNG
jgi:hypothetical protein